MTAPALYSTGSRLPHARREELLLVDGLAPTETEVVARVSAVA